MTDNYSVCHHRTQKLSVMWSIDIFTSSVLPLKPVHCSLVSHIYLHTNITGCASCYSKITFLHPFNHLRPQDCRGGAVCQRNKGVEFHWITRRAYSGCTLDKIQAFHMTAPTKSYLRVWRCLDRIQNSFENSLRRTQGTFSWLEFVCHKRFRPNNGSNISSVTMRATLRPVASSQCHR